MIQQESELQTKEQWDLSVKLPITETQYSRGGGSFLSYGGAEDPGIAHQGGFYFF